MQYITSIQNIYRLQNRTQTLDFFGWCGILFVNLLTGVLNRANKLKLLSCRPIVTC